MMLVHIGIHYILGLFQANECLGHISQLLDRTYLIASLCDLLPCIQPEAYVLDFEAEYSHRSPPLKAIVQVDGRRANTTVPLDELRERLLISAVGKFKVATNDDLATLTECCDVFGIVRKLYGHCLNLHCVPLTPLYAI